MLACLKLDLKIFSHLQMRKKAGDMYNKAVEREPCMWHLLLPCIEVSCLYTVRFLSTDDLQLLIECQKTQQKVLYRVNMELARTHDTMAQAYAVQGQCKTHH